MSLRSLGGGGRSSHYSRDPERQNRAWRTVRSYPPDEFTGVRIVEGFMIVPHVKPEVFFAACLHGWVNKWSNEVIAYSREHGADVSESDASDRIGISLQRTLELGD